MRLAARKGFKKAAVAAARKIAVVMLRLWRDGTTFAWTKEALPACPHRHTRIRSTGTDRCPTGTEAG